MEMHPCTAPCTSSRARRRPTDRRRYARRLATGLAAFAAAELVLVRIRPVLAHEKWFVDAPLYPIGLGAAALTRTLLALGSAAVALGVSATATWFLNTVSTRVQRRFRDNGTGAS